MFLRHESEPAISQWLSTMICFIIDAFVSVTVVFYQNHLLSDDDFLVLIMLHLTTLEMFHSAVVF